jgi:5-methylcytosine-specific restriction endonuclease McrA
MLQTWRARREQQQREQQQQQRPSGAALPPRHFPPYLLTVEGSLVSRREARPPPRNRRAFMVLARRQDYRCAGCAELLHPDSQADHVVPWSLSGDDADGNVQILCPNCHAAKSAEEQPRIRRARATLLRLQEAGRQHLEGLCWGCLGVRSVFFAAGCAACSEGP